MVCKWNVAIKRESRLVLVVFEVSVLLNCFACAWNLTKSIISLRICTRFFLWCACRMIDDKFIFIHSLIEIPYKNAAIAMAISHAAIIVACESSLNWIAIAIVNPMGVFISKGYLSNINKTLKCNNDWVICYVHLPERCWQFKCIWSQIGCKINEIDINCPWHHDTSGEIFTTTNKINLLNFLSSWLVLSKIDADPGIFKSGRQFRKRKIYNGSIKFVANLPKTMTL